MQRSPPVLRRWRLFRIALFFLLLLAPLGIAAAWGWSASHLAVARREAGARRFRSAWEHLEQAQLTWPLEADAHLLAAQVARQLGKTDQARVHLQEHDSLGAESRGSALERSLLLAQEGDLAEQELLLLKMVESNHPQSLDIVEALARGYLRRHQPDGLERLLQLWTDRLAISCWRGRVHYYLGHYPQAVADLTPFEEPNPDWDEVRLELARACYLTGYVAESLRHYRHLQVRNPPSPDALLGLSLCLQDQSRLDEAAAVLDGALANTPDHYAVLVERGRVAYRQGRPQEGEDWARRAAEIAPTAPDAHRVLALCLEAQGRRVEAGEQQKRWQTLDAAHYHLRQIIPRLATPLADADLYYQYGSLLLVLGNKAEAREALEHALQREPDHPPTHRLLSEYYAGQVQPEQAKELHRQAEAP